MPASIGSTATRASKGSNRRDNISTGVGSKSGSYGSVLSENLSEIKRARFRAFIIKNMLTFATLLGVFLGLVLGATFKHSRLFGKDYWTPRRLSYVKVPGELFQNMLRCMSVPIIVSSLMAALGSLDVKSIKFTLWRIGTYICCSAIAASAFGALFVILIHPGDAAAHPLHPACFEETPEIQVNATYTYRESLCSKDGHPCSYFKYDNLIWGKQAELIKLQKNTKPNPSVNVLYCSESFNRGVCELSADAYLDLVRSFLPSNIVQAFLKNGRTRPNLVFPENRNDPTFPGESITERCRSYLNAKSKPRLEEYHIERVVEARTNVHGLIMFSMVVALAGLHNTESGRPALNFVTSLSECTLKMGTWIIWLSPISVASIVAGNLLEQTSFFLFPPTVLYYVLACVSGLVVYSLVVLPLLYYFYVRKSPVQFYKMLVPVLAVKWGTSSGTGTLPVTIDFLEGVCELDPRVVRLMLPISSQIGSNGTALVTAVGVGFVSQLHGVELGLGTFFSIVFYTFWACVYTPSDDTDAGNLYFLRRLYIGLFSVGLPFEFGFYVSATRWIIDGLAAVTNALADCVGCAIIHQLSVSHFEGRQVVVSASSLGAGAGGSASKENTSLRSEKFGPQSPSRPVPEAMKKGALAGSEIHHGPGGIFNTIPSSASASAADNLPHKKHPPPHTNTNQIGSSKDKDKKGQGHGTGSGLSQSPSVKSQNQNQRKLNAHSKTSAESESTPNFLEDHGKTKDWKTGTGAGGSKHQLQQDSKSRSGRSTKSGSRKTSPQSIMAASSTHSPRSTRRSNDLTSTSSASKKRLKKSKSSN